MRKQSIISLVLLTVFSLSLSSVFSQSSLYTFTYQSVRECVDKTCYVEELKKGLIVIDLPKNSIIITSALSDSAEAVSYVVDKKSIQNKDGRDALRIDAHFSQEKVIFFVYKGENTSKDPSLTSKYPGTSAVILCFFPDSKKYYYFYCK